MKNIIEILKANGIEIDEEKAKTLTDEVLKNYKTIADYENQSAKLKNAESKLEGANATITDLNDTIKKSEGSAEEIENLKKQVADYETAETERAEKEKADKADKELTDKIVGLFGESEFTSDYVRSGLINDIKKRHSEDSTSGLKDIYEELTKDKEGIFVNPQQKKVEIPKAGEKGEEKVEFKNFF